MRNLSLLIVIFFTLLIFACGNKKENTEQLETADNEIIEGTLEDTANDYTGIISDGFTDESGIIDSSKSEPIVYTDASKEMQVDPPINNKTVNEPVKEKTDVDNTNKEKKNIEKKNIEKKDTEKPVIKSHETKFYIVAGSFKKYSNAQNLFDLFKQKGYEPLILPNSNGYNRVAIVSYMQENEARKALAKLRNTHNDITFWLYKW